MSEKSKKARAYAEYIRGENVTTKKLTEKSLVLAEIEKKKAKDNLTHMHTMYTKL